MFDIYDEDGLNGLRDKDTLLDWRNNVFQRFDGKIYKPGHAEPVWFCPHRNPRDEWHYDYLCPEDCPNIHLPAASTRLNPMWHPFLRKIARERGLDEG